MGDKILEEVPTFNRKLYWVVRLGEERGGGGSYFLDRGLI